jgi:hypothetical protein
MTGETMSDVDNRNAVFIKEERALPSHQSQIIVQMISKPRRFS